MSRPALNLWVDLFAFFLLVGMAATGFVIWWPLPPGTNKDLILWGFSRHQWGEGHAWLSAALLSVLCIHLCLHWRWIAAMLSNRVNKHKTSALTLGIIAAISLLAVIALFMIAAFRGVTPIKDTCLALIDWADLSSSAWAQSADGGEATTGQVKTFLEDNCVSCHGPKKTTSNLRLDNLEQLMHGANPWIVAHSPETSRLVLFLRAPPSEMKRRAKHEISAENLKLIETWVANNAK